MCRDELPQIATYRLRPVNQQRPKHRKMSQNFFYLVVVNIKSEFFLSSLNFLLFWFGFGITVGINSMRSWSLCTVFLLSTEE